MASGSIGPRHSQAAQRPVIKQLSPDLVYGITGSRGARQSKALHTCSHLGSWSGSAISGPLLAALPSFLPAAFFLGGILLFRVSEVVVETDRPCSCRAIFQGHGQEVETHASDSWLIGKPPKSALRHTVKWKATAWMRCCRTSNPKRTYRTHNSCWYAATLCCTVTALLRSRLPCANWLGVQLLEEVRRHTMRLHQARGDWDRLTSARSWNADTVPAKETPPLELSSYK